MGEIAKVTPDRLKVIVCMGCEKDGSSSAKSIEKMLNMPYVNVMDALEGLWATEVVATVGRESYALTDYGWSLFEAIYDATGAVLGGRDG